MSRESASDADAAIAEKAFGEVNRLVDEATRRFRQEQLIEATSSLAAISSVVEPLVGLISHSWLTRAAGLEEADAELVPQGVYL